MITPRQFVDNWSQSKLRETQGYQSHFNELCQLVGHKTPTQMDAEGTFFTFEENVEKATGGRGRADVWYKGHFAWEYKGKHKDLDAAYAQVSAYRAGLDNPPLLVVCDFIEYRIYPQWPNTSGQPFIFRNEDLLEREAQNYIRWLLQDPDKFKQQRQTELERREKITLALAEKFAHLADLMRDGEAGWSPMQIARFLTRLVFVLFTEDIGLLPVIANTQPAFRFIIDGAKRQPESFVSILHQLFQAMEGDVSNFFSYPVPYFNGGLFADSAPGAGDGMEVLDLTHIPGAINLLEETSEADWRFVNPTIFGTLFEGALDKSKRAQLGAHYTSEADIRLVVEPVLMGPLDRLWSAIEAEAQPLMQTFLSPDTPPRPYADAQKRLTELHDQMMNTLGNMRVLDPACGSGNFLYVSLRTMKDLEGRVRKFFEPLGQPFIDVVTPRQLYGIEKDEFAARLAQVVVWIGYLQWRYEDDGMLHPYLRASSSPHPRQLPNPIIQDKLSADDPEHIVNADAIMRYDTDGQPYEPDWPEVDVIVGNPPFLGDKRMRSEMGDEYVETLRTLYDGRVPGGADLVTYWYEKSRAAIEIGKDLGEHRRAGLLATNSIRDGASNKVIQHIKETGDIFMAWSDRDWSLDGAAVNVSVIGFDDGTETERILDGKQVNEINSDLTAEVNVIATNPLSENAGLCFLGMMKSGPFDIDNSIAQEMLNAPNPDGMTNSNIVKPRLAGQDITGRSANTWIIDFGVDASEEQATFYKLPFEYILNHVKPIREKNRRARTKERWWILGEARPGLRKAIRNLKRCIVTPEVAKHRIFTWMDTNVIPDHTLHVIARDDDYFFGVLHSRIHELWSLQIGSTLEDRPRYSSSRTFENFPFPWSPGKEDTAAPAHAAISAAAQTLHAERDLWLNPSDLLALGANADSPALRERTLTNLYNALAAHRRDKANTDKAHLVPTIDTTDPVGTGRALSEFEPTERNGNGSRIPKTARDFAPRLAQLHDALDRAVLAAYGWDDLFEQLRTPVGDEELLRRLLALNLERSS